jgi:hypothetical protein
MGMPSAPTDVPVPSVPSLEAAPSGADIPFAPTTQISGLGCTTAETEDTGAVPTKEVIKLALFHYDEVIRGRCLGHGGFSDVYEVLQFKPLRENDENFSKAHLLLDDDDGARRFYTEQMKEDSVEKFKKYAGHENGSQDIGQN